MVRHIAPIIALLLSFAILCMGHGLQSVLIPARATLEHFSDFTMGVIMSAYYVGFIGGTFLCPWLIRRVGHIRVFAAAAASASAMMLAHVLAPNPWAWIIFRVIYGLAMVHLYTVMESWLNSIAAKEDRGKILSAYMVVIFVSMALGQLLFFVKPAEGFELFAIASMILSLALVPLIVSRIRQPIEMETPHAFGLKELYSISPLGMAGAFIAGLLGSAYWGFAASYAMKIGFTQNMAALFMAISFLGGLMAQWPLGALSDRINRRYVILISCALISVSSFALAGAAIPDGPPEQHRLIWLTFWGIIFGAGLHPLYSLCIAHTNDFVEPQNFVKASVGLQLIQSIGAITGPLVAGALISIIGNAALYLYMAALSSLLAGYIFVRLRTNRIPVEKEKKPFHILTKTGIFAFMMDPRSHIRKKRGTL